MRTKSRNCARPNARGRDDFTGGFFLCFRTRARVACRLSAEEREMHGAGAGACETLETACRASLFRLASLVENSCGRQTIASHKGSKIKAWKEKVAEKRGREKEDERRHLTLQAARIYTFSRRPFTPRCFFQPHTF